MAAARSTDSSFSLGTIVATLVAVGLAGGLGWTLHGSKDIDALDASLAELRDQVEAGAAAPVPSSTPATRSGPPPSTPATRSGPPSTPATRSGPPSTTGGDADVAALAREVGLLREQVRELREALKKQLLVPGVYYTVERVVDGDTFVVEGGWKVRMLGVNTPESVDSSTGVQWYGIDSSNFTKKLIEGKKVRLEPEPGDKLEGGAYNRILAYVYREDGTDVNAALVQAGAGFSYHKYPCSRRAEFDRLQAEAKAGGIGMWDDAARLAWEDTHIIPEVPLEEATVIVSKGSDTVHLLTCGRCPAIENGILFKDIAQATKFRFTKFHSCVQKQQEKEKAQ